MFRLMIIILTITALWTKNIRFIQGSPKGAGRASVSSTIAQVFEPMTKPANDKRLYKGLVLKNGMKVLLINDPFAKKAAASMVVGVGALNDFSDIPGLANLVAYLLMQGSTEYPDEFAFYSYLKTRDGRTEFPVTRSGDQNFTFDVSPSFLAGALERFAQFFLKPLLIDSPEDIIVEHSVVLINANYLKQKENDDFRIMEVEKIVCKGNHRYKHLHNGNLNTLYEHARHIETSSKKSESLIEQARTFHRLFYSSSIMNLVVLGRESLKTLEEMVVPLFSEVKKIEVIPIVYTSRKYHPWGVNQMKHKIYVVPLDKEIQKVRLNFPVSNFCKQYKTSPDLLIKYIFSHKAPGSLISVLEAEDFSHKLSVVNYCCPSGISVFNITCHLTDKGLEYVDDVIHLIFKYIRLMSNDQEALERLYHERSTLQKIAFNENNESGNEQPMSYVKYLAYRMQFFPLQDILSQGHLMQERYEPLIVKELLDCLTPENTNITIVTKSLASWDEDLLVEEYYGAKYMIEKIPEEILKVWRDAEPIFKVQLPTITNDMIPKRLDFYPLDKNESASPHVIYKSSKSELWFKQDDQFKTYGVHVDIEIFSSIPRLGPFELVSWYMFDDLLINVNRIHLYTVQLAGVGLETALSDNSVLFRIHAFTDTLPSILQKLFRIVNNVKDDPYVDEERFNTLRKDVRVRILRKAKREHWNQMNWYMLHLRNTSNPWSLETTLTALRELSFDDFKKVMAKAFRRIFIRTFVHGNCSRQKAIEMAKILEESFPNSHGMLPQEIIRSRNFDLEEGSNFIHHVFNENRGIYGCSTYFQLNTRPSTFHNVAASVFHELIKSHCENIIKDDLGIRVSESSGAPFVVQCFVLDIYGPQGFFIVSISEKDPRSMDSAMERFLRKVPSLLLKDTSKDEFERSVKNTLESKNYKKATGLVELSKRYWYEISNGLFNFVRNETEREQLAALKKPDVMNFFKQVFGESPSRRRKLAVHLYPESTATEDMKLPKNVGKMFTCQLL